MEFLEYIYYESLPFVYAALSGFAFYHHKTSTAVGLSAFVLAFCSYQVFFKRFQYRTYTSRYKNRTRL